MFETTDPALALAPDVAASWFFDNVRSSAFDPASTGERFALVEHAAPAGSMAPLYRRSRDESYAVLEGEVTFFVGDEIVPASAGDVVVAPAEVARTFRVESDRARWLIHTRVTSLERFEDFGRAVSPPATAEQAVDWHLSQDAASLAAIAQANGIEVVGPPGRLPTSV